MSSGYLRYPHIRGDLLTFVAGDDVWLAPAAGGRAWRLSADDVPVSYPRFSRDGSRVAWTSWRDGNPEVYSADTEGSTADRLTYWGDPQTRVTGWTAGGEVLAVTAAGQPAQKYRRAYVIQGDGATPPRLLPFGAVNDLALEEAGTALLTGSVAGEPAFWKRYRGGRVGKVWIAAGQDPPPTPPAPFTRVLGDLDGQLAAPMLIAGRLFFLSDHEGTGNIYSCALDWFRVSGDGTRIVVRDHDELRVVPSARKHDDAGETVVVDQTRARFQADPDALWRHAYGEAGRFMRRDFWTPDMSGVDWDGVLGEYRPVLDRIRGAADFADLLLEVLGELGTSHAYVTPAWNGMHAHTPVGQLGADISRDEDGRWVVDRVLPGESSDPRARSPLAAPGVAVHPGDELVAVDGQQVDPRRGPWPLLAGTAGKPVELTVRPRGQSETRHAVVVPLRGDRRLRYQDWVASRRLLVRELGDGRLGYLHIPDMMGEGWAHFHRDLRTEMRRDGLIFDVRGNSGGHISELVVEKLAQRVIARCLGRWLRPVPYPYDARRGPLVTVADEFAGSDGDIVTAAIKVLGLGPVVGTRTWGGVIGIEGRHGLVDGTSISIPRNAFWFDEYGWGVENHGVDPDVEVLVTPGDAAAGRDVQLETAVQLALEALDKQPLPALPEVADGAVKARRPLPPRPGSPSVHSPGIS